MNNYLSAVLQGNQVFINSDTGELDEEWTGYFGITSKSLMGDLEEGMLFHILGKPWIHINSYINSMILMMKEAKIHYIVYSLNGVRYKLIPSSESSVEKFKEQMNAKKDMWYDMHVIVKGA